MDVDHNSLHRQADAACSRLDDAAVGLVWDPEIDVMHGQTRRTRGGFGPANQDLTRELEYVRAIHCDEGSRLNGVYRPRSISGPVVIFT